MSMFTPRRGTLTNDLVFLRKNFFILHLNVSDQLWINISGQVIVSDTIFPFS